MNKNIYSVQDLINDARGSNATEIDFSKLKDTPRKIPENLFDLNHLEEINFGGIPIDKFPNKIRRLSRLRSIKTESSEIKIFPLELMEIGLTDLTLSGSSITELPKELKDWHTLGYLNLMDSTKLTQIKGLPPGLDYLNIGYTGIKKMSETIYSLMYLLKIVVNGLALTNLPVEICYLPKLRALFAGDNNLKNLPDEIVNMQNLEELVLYRNQFSHFPKSIVALKNLKKLQLSENHISNLISEVAALSKLTSLDLADNAFDRVPDEIRNLHKLKHLYLNNFIDDESHSINKIREIPEWLLGLNLKSLNIIGNPIENVPEEIVSKGINAIKDFLSSKLEADKEEFLLEAKMVIVGRGNVGKSVLTKKLTIENYSLSKNETTKGIDILKNPFMISVEISDKTEDFKFNIWDFGGQEKYDATHQLFITNRSIYLFLTEAREESNYSDFQFWLNTIQLFSNNSPVIVVLSKWDERKKLFPESLYKETFKNIVKFVEVSSADGYEHTIVNLKKAISDAVLLLPQTKQKLSNRWISVRNELERLSNKKDYISYEEYLTVCERNKLGKTQANFLSQYLNDLGVVVHHQYDLLLKKTVFVNTDWCVDGMYKVLDDENVMNNNGKFTNETLERIWDEKRFENKQEELLKLMKEYNLCFELKDNSGFIAPDLLPPDKPHNLNWNLTHNLHFEYRYNFMPSGILSRFIVKSHGLIKDNLYWKYGVVLEYESCLALIEEDYINGKIKICISGEYRKGLLSAIRMLIEEVHRDFSRNNELSFDEMVPCNCSECVHGVVPHFYKFSVLKKFEQKAIEFINCERSVENVRIANLISDVQIKKSGEVLETDRDLKNFILDLMYSVLEKEIYFKDGFMNFWRDAEFKNPKNEIEIQPYISNTLDNFCKVRGINLSREVREANGSVDVIFSYTSKYNEILKVCVEIKKAHHQDVVTAINTQLPLYMKSADTNSAIYLVVWYKHLHYDFPKKFKTEKGLVKAIERNNPQPNNISIKLINCCKKTSPSKNKTRIKALPK